MGEMRLIPILYRGKAYPKGIEPSIEEIAGHFDKTNIKVNKPYYSLHTEYSAVERSFSSELIKKYNCICKAHKKIYQSYGIVKNGHYNLLTLLKNLQKEIENQQ